MEGNYGDMISTIDSLIIFLFFHRRIFTNISTTVWNIHPLVWTLILIFIFFGNEVAHASSQPKWILSTHEKVHAALDTSNKIISSADKIQSATQKLLAKQKLQAELDKQKIAQVEKQAKIFTNNRGGNGLIGIYGLRIHNQHLCDISP